MKIKKIILLALVVAICAFAAYRFVLSKKTPVVTEEAPALVETETAKYGGRIEEGFVTTSTLKALEEVEMTAKVSARITSIKAKRGSYVKAGAVLVGLDSRESQAEAASQKAQISISIAEAAQYRTKLADAKREYERYGRLLKEGYATQQEYDSRGTTYNEAKAEAQRAEASVQQARAQLSAKNAGLSEYTLRAPISGVVLEDYDIAPGTMVNNGSNVMRIANIDKLRAVVSIPEKNINGIRKGMEGEVTCDGIPGVTFRGTVSVINPYVDESTRTVTAEVLVENTDRRLKPGMFSNVKFVQKSETHPLVIPSDAILNDSEVKAVVDGRVKTIKITTGASQNGRTSVKSGLKEGDVVILSGAKNLKDSDKVTTEASKKE